MSRELLVWRRPMLAWYRRHRRDLPWRRTRDPYRIWVSEVMLQQTQVATARPYYGSFLRRFPTLRVLAAASEPQVLAAWAGLGYYRRARHLLEASRIVVRDHAGRVPDDPQAFSRLPGVGRYTVGAVLSIAFDRPLAVLDGNVGRVLSRWFAWPVSVRDARGAQRLWGRADSLVPMRRPGEWNQALMELGATICTPRRPRCPECPVKVRCRAFARGRPEDFPPATRRRATERIRRAVVLVERSGRVLMVRREGALLAGLWEPPGIEVGERQETARDLGAALAAVGVRAGLEPTARRVRHTITHRSIEVEVWKGTLAAAAPRRSTARFVDPRRPGVPLTALAAKLTDPRRSLRRK
jgi:A/G-specific adenine glycosylase